MEKAVAGVGLVFLNAKRTPENQPSLGQNYLHGRDVSFLENYCQAMR
jgi:hypothetical protein